jgi:hypothetical protein
VRITEKTSCLPDPLVPLDTKDRSRSSPGQRTSKKSNSRSNGAIKGRCGLDSTSQPSVSHTNGPPTETNSVTVKPEAAIDSGSRDSRATSIDRFSDVSRHSNSSRGYLVRQSLKFKLIHSFANCLFSRFQCDSESEDRELEKANNHQELRGLSPNGGINRPTEFIAPVKRSFSPGHASVATNSHNNINNASSSSSSSNAPAGENCNSLRWVGLSGSPRPATAVAPLGHLQVCIAYVDMILRVCTLHKVSSVFHNKEWTETVGLSANGRRCRSESGWTSGSSFTSVTVASSGCWIST